VALHVAHVPARRVHPKLSGRPRHRQPLQTTAESYVTERQDEEARGTRDANVHYVHTGGARLAARRIIIVVSIVRTCDNTIAYQFMYGYIYIYKVM